MPRYLSPYSAAASEGLRRKLGRLASIRGAVEKQRAKQAPQDWTEETRR